MKKFFNILEHSSLCAPRVLGGILEYWNDGIMVEKFLARIENIQSFLNNITDGVSIIDMDRKIRFMNRKAKEMLGYTDKEVISVKCKKIVQTTKGGEKRLTI